MALIVQKYGGSSVETVNLIKNVAKIIAKARVSGSQVLAVVSALGNTTDELIKKAYAVCKKPPVREMDALLSTGEQASSALLAMAVSALGYQAVSFTGLQVGILTDNSYTKAKIIDIKTNRIASELKKGKVVIVAGFQGVSPDHNITTLGRGGSDTTAMALAAKLKADVCEIYTDVDGVYSADPRLVKGAKKLKTVSYDEMLEMASSGSKILQLRAVEYGRNYGVKIHVKSSLSDENGTIVEEKSPAMEKAIISSIAHNIGEAKVTIIRVPDKPGIAAQVFGELADNNVNVDMILQNVSAKGFTDISFTVNIDDLPKAKEVMQKVKKSLGARTLNYDTQIAKVTLVGAGMKSHPGVAAKMFSVLAKNKINIDMISTSSIKISCVIRAKEVKKAVNVLHKAFGLGKK